MFDASINAGNHTSNIACALSQRYTKSAVLWLAQMTLWILSVQTSFKMFLKKVVNTSVGIWLILTYYPDLVVASLTI